MELRGRRGDRGIARRRRGAARDRRPRGRLRRGLLARRQQRESGRRRMSGRRLDFILPAVIAAAGAAALGVWLSATRTENVKPRLPGEEESLGFADEVRSPPAPINTGTTIAGPGAPSQLTGSWPAVSRRGPDERRPRAAAPGPRMAARRTEGALETARRRRARGRGNRQRLRLPRGLRCREKGRRHPLPVARRRARNLALYVLGQGPAQPRHVAHRARRQRPLRGQPRPDVPGHLPRCPDGKAGLEIRPRQAVRRDRAAVVRRPVPAD